MFALKQPSAEPLDCSVQRMKVERSSKRVRAADRAAARLPRCQRRSLLVQRRDLVRHAEPLKRKSLRSLYPRRS